MNRPLIFLLAIGLTICFSFKNSPSVISLETALKEKRVQITALGNADGTHYTVPIELQVKNTQATPVQIVIDNGLMFEAAEAEYQNMLVTKKEIIELAANQTRKIAIHGMCTEHSDRAPGKTTAYKLGKKAPDDLAKLAAFIETNKYFDPVAQNAVWCLANKDPLETITSFDDKETNAILDFICKTTGQKKPRPPSEDDYRRNLRSQVLSIPVTGSFSFQFPSPKKVHLALFNKNNVIVRELYQEDNAVGDKKIDYQYDAAVFTDEYYFLKLIIDGKVVMNKKREFIR